VVGSGPKIRVEIDASARYKGGCIDSLCRQHDDVLLGVHHQEEEVTSHVKYYLYLLTYCQMLSILNGDDDVQ